MAWRFACLLMVCCLAQSVIALAQDNDREEGMEIVRQSLRGWKGITFRCLPDVDGDSFQDGICKEIAAEARLLAATGNIPFHDVSGKDQQHVSFDAAANNFFQLEVRLRMTKGDFRAVYMEMVASSFYLGAIEKDAKPGDPESQPRDGDLVFHSNDVLGRGPTNADFAKDLTNLMATELKEFIALVIESRNR